MSGWQYYNPSPDGKHVGDCVVRAIACALETDWFTAYAILCTKGMELLDMPSANHVWGAVLRDHGYRSRAIPDTCPACYTVADFARDHKNGTYVLGTGSHAVTVADGGTIYDSWDSSGEVPIIYFYKEDAKK